MVNALINWSLTAVTMNFEGIIAIINLNQWFITAIMWSFLLMVSRAACTIALEMFLWWLITLRGGVGRTAHLGNKPRKVKVTGGNLGCLCSIVKGSGMIRERGNYPQLTGTSCSAEPLRFQTPDPA